MRTPLLACIALTSLALGARAQPELRELETKWETEAARSDYVFLWDLDVATIGRGDPYRTFRTLYDGLMYAVTESRRWVEPGTPTSMQLQRVGRIDGWDEAYAGKVSTHETYISGEPVLLHVEITRRDCDRNRVQVLFVLSRSPPDNPAWNEMRAARNRLTCKK